MPSEVIKVQRTRRDDLVKWCIFMLLSYDGEVVDVGCGIPKATDWYLGVQCVSTNHSPQHYPPPPPPVYTKPNPDHLYDVAENETHQSSWKSFPFSVSVFLADSSGIWCGTWCDLQVLEHEPCIKHTSGHLSAGLDALCCHMVGWLHEWVGIDALLIVDDI